MIKVNDAIIIKNVLDTNINTNSVIIVTDIDKYSNAMYLSGKTLDGTRVRDLNIEDIEGLVRSNTAVVLRHYNINILRYLYK
jgi:hypothetical protein